MPFVGILFTLTGAYATYYCSIFWMAIDLLCEMNEFAGGISCDSLKQATSQMMFGEIVNCLILLIVTCMSCCIASSINHATTVNLTTHTQTQQYLNMPMPMHHISMDQFETKRNKPKIQSAAIVKKNTKVLVCVFSFDFFFVAFKSELQP